MEDGRYLTLKVKGYDLANRYFVLSDVLRRFPDDLSITAVFHEHSDDYTLFRLHSSKFPAIPGGTIIPQAFYSYDVNTGSTIKWPSKEYEDVALDSLSNSILEDAVNKDAEVMEAEGGPSAAAREQMQIEFAKMMTGMPSYKSTAGGCNHEWFAYGRGAATKHCKKCMVVRENKVDSNE